MSKQILDSTLQEFTCPAFSDTANPSASQCPTAANSKLLVTDDTIVSQEITWKE